MEERIASAPEGRPFDQAAAAANIGRLSADMDRIAEADHRRERENIESAYREEAAGLRVRRGTAFGVPAR